MALRRPINKPTPQIVDFLRSHCLSPWCVEEGHKLCTPATLDGVEDYGVRISSQHDGRDGVSFVGKVYLNGVAIMSVSNAGDGGPNYYDPIKGQSREVFQENLNTYKSVAQNAFGEGYEREDLLTEWLMDVDNIRVVKK